mgnify:CR=1 FL=1
MATALKTIHTPPARITIAAINTIQVVPHQMEVSSEVPLLVP